VLALTAPDAVVTVANPPLQLALDVIVDAVLLPLRKTPRCFQGLAGGFHLPEGFEDLRRFKGIRAAVLNELMSEKFSAI
jgi:hypothetical protein